MTQDFSKTEEPWSRIPAFMRDGVVVGVQMFAGDDHSAATTVFTSKNNSEVFHADKYCHRLHRGETYTIDGEERQTIYAHPLEKIMTTWLDPIRPCDYCTQDIETTAKIVQEHDGVPEKLLKYYEPGDKRVSQQWSKNADGSWDLVEESATEVY
jgi:nitrous oxide reductase